MSINRRVVRQLKGSLTWSDRKQALLSEDASSAHLGQPSDQSPTPLASNVNLDATHSQLQNLTDQIYDLCRRRDFAASHQIAMCMITLAPHLAVGYCRKADVYVLQGSTLEAIEILNKGLARVPVSSSESDLILAAKKRVREQMVDFVSRLPFDILCHVLKFIPDQPFLLKQCMLVSKTWRQHVSQCVPLWKEVQVASENYYCPNALVIIGSHIKKLHARLCSGVWLSILFRLMAKGVFANLKELKFYHVTYQGVSDLDTILLAALRERRHTLEVLQIRVYSKSVTLPSILCACPNLITLKYTNSIAFDDAPRLPYRPRITTLKLTLTGNEGPILKEQLEVVLRACPNLRQLAINQCCTDHLAVFRHYCPRLELLCLNTNIGEEWLDERTMANVSYSDDRLFRLAVCPSSVEQLEKLLEDHANILEMLSIDFYGIDSFRTPPKVGRFKFEKLRMLRIVGAFHMGAAHFLRQLLRSCCVLEEMSLCGFPFIHFDGFCAMVELPLKRVELSRIEVTNGLDHYLERLGTFGSTCSLTSLVLNECVITDTEIASLALVRSLSELVISNYYNPITGPHIDSALNRLFQGQAAASRLEHLTLDYPFTRSEILASIGKITSLRTLKLRDGAWLYYITDDDIEQFSDNFPHIRLEW